MAAIDNVRLEFGSLNFAGADLSQLDINLSLSANGLAMQASADTFAIAGQQFNNVSLICQQFKIAAQFWQCQQGQLKFVHATFGTQQLDVTFSANTESAQYQASINKLAMANGQLNINAALSKQNWQADIDSQQVELPALIDLLTIALPKLDLSIVSSWQPRGQISGEISVNGAGAQIDKADIKITSDDFSFSDDSGNRVAETLALELNAIINNQQQDWQFLTDIKIKSGESYWSPIFLDFQKTPARLALNGLLQPAQQNWQILNFDFQQQDVMTANGAVQFKQKQLQALTLNISPSPLAAIYQWWLQPFAAGTAGANLVAEGDMSVQLEWQDQQLDLQADLQQLSITDVAERFAIVGLDGKFAWTTGQRSVPVNITWQQIQFGALPIAAGQLQAVVVDNQLNLNEPMDLPLLDGGLQISEFSYQYAPTGSDWQFAGLLKPVSMQDMTAALGWPSMDGKLSGVIPRVSYRDEQVDIEGALQVQVFDGTVIIKDLQMQSPFGSLPQLTANIDLQRLDLELLTRTFDFGKITGRLDGRVSGLRLSNWQPVQFDANFATAETNPGKRRISQRAVNNLSQIGGGASGIMSRSFLRFFDDFSYDKLGIHCQLTNEVCQMSGIEDDEQGYYIVKAGGLPPWINVMGYTRRVDWPDLLARLKAVKNSDGPIIE